MKEEVVKLINECIEESKLTERIELDIGDLSRLLNGMIMEIEFKEPIKYLQIKFNEGVMKYE